MNKNHYISNQNDNLLFFSCLSASKVGDISFDVLGNKFKPAYAICTKSTTKKQPENRRVISQKWQQHHTLVAASPTQTRNKRKTSYGDPINIRDERYTVLKSGIPLPCRPLEITGSLEPYVWLIKRYDAAPFVPKEGAFLFLLCDRAGDFYKPTKTVQNKLWKGCYSSSVAEENRKLIISNDGKEHRVPIVCDQWLRHYKDTAYKKQQRRGVKRRQQREENKNNRKKNDKQ